MNWDEQQAMMQFAMSCLGAPIECKDGGDEWLKRASEEYVALRGVIRKDLEAKITQLEQEKAIAVEALEFYEFEENYKEPFSIIRGYPTYSVEPVIKDTGTKARQALAEIRPEKEATNG